jgi:hypothetical protein
MIDFPTFAELEEARDKENEHFHKNTAPQLTERLKQFGFRPTGAKDNARMVLTEKATDNNYHLSINRYNITVRFQHIKTGESILICDISNFALNAHTMLNIIIKSVDFWLKYGVIYDYVKAQNLDAEK